MRVFKLIVLNCFIFLLAASNIFGEIYKNIPVTIKEQHSALEIYEAGFARNVMRDSYGVRLFDMELLEDDSPGAGQSEKGSNLQPVYGRLVARKDLYLADIRTNGAFLVFYMLKAGSKPLIININGHEVSYESEKTRWRTLSFASS